MIPLISGWFGAAITAEAAPIDLPQSTNAAT